MINKALMLAVVILGISVLTKAQEPPFNKMAQAVVKLYRGPGEGGGTGFLAVSPKGTLAVVTAWHVCRGRDSLTAEREGEFSDIKIKPLAVDAANDICVLEPVPGKPLPLGAQPVKNQPLFVYGYPYMRGPAPGEGYFISNAMLTFFYPLEAAGCFPGLIPTMGIEGMSCAQIGFQGETTVPVFPGNSGSPITDIKGAVVGVATATDVRTNFGSLSHVINLRKVFDVLEARP